RAAAGRRRHVWPAVERTAGLDGDTELDDPERLEAIPEPELALLRDFARTIAGLRERAGRLSLAGLIDATIAATGYDLAILMRPAGEARFANIRKLMRLAAEFEAREGRDLRGLLDFLASRAEADADAEAASALEGHDGVRIMTVHSAKGLEFGVVAVPSLSRRLLAAARLPALTLGHESERPRVGLQLRRLGAASINLYSQEELCKEAQAREAEEELRLFHVAATRARERLILSGVAMPQGGRGTQPGTPVIERILDGFEVDRERDSEIPIPAPQPREGLSASFEPSRIAVRVSLPSSERAAALTATGEEPIERAPLGEGEAPLLERNPPAVPNRPLSYTAIAAYKECGYRFQMERVLDLGDRVRPLSRIATQRTNASADGGPGSRDDAAARGAAVHSLLEWSAANEWREPDGDIEDELLAPVRAWLASGLLRERVQAPKASSRAEVPLLVRVGDAVLRGSIDLLVERDSAPPLVIDYKTDRLGASTAAERASKYATQRTIYALAVAEAHGAAAVEVAYVFLERPEEPVVELLDAEAMERGREELAATIARIAAGEFPVAAAERRSWGLCRGCPALGRLCSGPVRQPQEATPTAPPVDPA
ncbi:MAG TPA: PD-(D/E)XK nuclease family protein, partial [Solirubrobacterales bacterium]|nr:PD-(D/E)XK nuclease family protein [Solirubrobacterales bacterium]